MKELEKIVQARPARITFSKSICEYNKAVIRPATVKGHHIYQLEFFTKTQAFHENIEPEKLYERLCQLMSDRFRQLDASTENGEFSLGISKKGKVLFNHRAGSTSAAPTAHNRQKNYLLCEGTPVPALVDLGVMTGDGKIVKARYDKFKQINRFTELVHDILKDDSRKEISVIDFGCGKSYLTFILYYYLTEIKKLDAKITGLDLKEQAIADCSRIARKYGYDGLEFKVGDVAGFHADVPCDMVITLHACDTATDFALFNAIKRGAKYIMSVPCCQHEINLSMKNCAVPLMEDYGILKERFAAIATDALRAALLTYCGYETQVLEFIDIAHSPKNLLIRATKKNVSPAAREAALQKAEGLLAMLGTSQTLYDLIKKEGL